LNWIACIRRGFCGTLQHEWETVQTSHHRDAIYRYLAAVFELVTWWDEERKAATRARRALHLQGYSSAKEPEPFAAVILCTADPDQVDDRTRSKWSRALRYAAEYKDPDEPLRDFIKRQRGINKCAARFARRLGRGSLRAFREDGAGATSIASHLAASGSPSPYRHSVHSSTRRPGTIRIKEGNYTSRFNRCVM
jgi:hypothetical protein